MSGCCSSLSLSLSRHSSAFLFGLEPLTIAIQHRFPVTRKPRTLPNGTIFEKHGGWHQATSGGGGRLRSRSTDDLPWGAVTKSPAEVGSFSLLTAPQVSGKKLLTTGRSNRQISSGFALASLNASKKTGRAVATGKLRRCSEARGQYAPAGRYILRPRSRAGRGSCGGDEVSMVLVSLGLPVGWLGLPWWWWSLLRVGKLVLAFMPRNSLAAASYARAASSAVSNVPSQTRVFFPGSRISAAYRPQGLFLTPLYRVSLLPKGVGQVVESLSLGAILRRRSGYGSEAEFLFKVAVKTLWRCLPQWVRRC